MTQSLNSFNDYLGFSTTPLLDSYTNPLEDKYADNYYPPIPYQDSDWMSTASSPDYSPKSTNVLPTLNNGFPSNWPNGSKNTPPSQSTKDIQKLNRRRQQNRESQRAFRQRKIRDLEQLENALADLQSKHEKLLRCFVGLTAKVSAERLGGLVEDMGFLDEQIKQYNSSLGTDYKMNGDRIQAIRAKTECF